MKQFLSVLGFALLLAGVFVSAAAVTAADRPNVILIMADDLGYETIAVNGGTSYKTPTLDKLAAGGVRFTHCFVQPLCTPTRVQLMTGKYNVRNYIDFGNMDPHAVTFGNYFKQAGYTTCIAGKWQLGRDPQLPNKYGFDEHCLWQHTRRPPRYANAGLEVNGALKDFSNGEYGPDIVNDYAIDFVSRHKDSPFFLYYPMMLTHGPYQPTPDSPDYDRKAIGENVNRDERHFGEMVTYMDKLIGKLVARLDELNLREKTLLIFVGDNGTGAGTRSMMGNKVVIGGKGSTTEAGMHVPMIVSWPKTAGSGTAGSGTAGSGTAGGGTAGSVTVGSGKVNSDLVDSTDFLPTICAAAAIDLPKDARIDGKSFLPQLRGETGSPRSWIYSWYSPRGEQLREFAFNHRYKLYQTGEFFDLASDPAEKNPLQVTALDAAAAKNAKELQSALDQYKDARPDDLPKPGRAEGAKAAKEKKGKRKKA